MLHHSRLIEGARMVVVTYRGETQDFHGEIISVRDLEADPIQPKTVTKHTDKVVSRSRYLVTMENLRFGEAGNEHPKVKAYYHRYIEVEEGVQS